MKKTFELEFYGKKLVVETGEIAKQADGAVFVRYNDTVVLSTVCCSDEPKEGVKGKLGYLQGGDLNVSFY